MPPTLSSGSPAHAASPVCRVMRMWPAPAWRSTASRSWESSCCRAASRPTSPHEDSHDRSEEHTSELQSQSNLVCRLLLEKKKKKNRIILNINILQYTQTICY